MAEIKLRPFPSREELEALPLHRLRNLDIESKDQEFLVQEVISLRVVKVPFQRFEARKDIDIKTTDEERVLQEKINLENARRIEATAIKELTTKSQAEDTPQVSEAISQPAPTASPTTPTVSETPQQGITYKTTHKTTKRRTTTKRAK